MNKIAYAQQLIDKRDVCAVSEALISDYLTLREVIFLGLMNLRRK